MMAHSKREREDWERTVLGLLWDGDVTEAIGLVRPIHWAMRFAALDYRGKPGS